MRRTRPEGPALITSAPVNPDDEYDQRRKKYAIMMSIRVLCVIAAALVYQVSILLALAFVVGGMVLPWCAVIIANDAPVRRRAPAPARPVYNTERLLTSGDDGRTVDG